MNIYNKMLIIYNISVMMNITGGILWQREKNYLIQR